MNEDDTHLNSLAIGHYIVGGLMCLFSCIPLIHVAMGIIFLVGGEEMFANGDNPPPDFIGWFFVTIGALFFLVGQAISISVIISGRYLHRRKNHLFSFILACVMCLFVPLGTILGVFSIIILSRDGVKKIYSDKKIAT